MGGVAYVPPASPDQVKAAIMPDVLAAIPQPSNAAPLSEKIGGEAGSQSPYARSDHQHQRLTSATYTTLDSSGQATVTFSRTFVNKPTLNLTETDATAGSQPLVLRSLTWVRDGNNLYTGVTIEGRRARMLPTLTPLSGALTLVTQVVTGVNAIVTALTSFDLFAGPATGATVSVIALAHSDVPST